MDKIDFNCFSGTWPFHRVRHPYFTDICRIHRKNGIEYGYISSTDAIFYNDPYEAELVLADEIRDSKYRHVMTVNLALPGAIKSIEHGVSKLNIAGVRLFPGFHGYSIISEEVWTLCEQLRNYRIPLFLTMRMEDERVTHLFHPKSIALTQLESFLEKISDIPIVICNIHEYELEPLQDVIKENENVFFDCSGLKYGTFPLEGIDMLGLLPRLIYGSVTPLFCLKSTMLMFEKTHICPQTIATILSGSNFLEVNNTFSSVSR